MECSLDILFGYQVSFIVFSVWTLGPPLADIVSEPVESWGDRTQLEESDQLGMGPWCLYPDLTYGWTSQSL